MEELQARLIEEYSQSIESSTILAILYDYDITNSRELAAARQILDVLKSSASEEECTGFDPSGASGPRPIVDEESVHDELESLSTSQNGSKTQTDDTSLSLDHGTLDFEGLGLGGEVREDRTTKSYSSELDKLDQAGKEQALVGIFPALKPFDIKWILKKCKGDAGLAIDELMTQAFLEESGARHRGIDAFSENDAAPRRKAKGKKKKGSTRIAGSPTTPPSSVESPVESKWDVGKQDIEFISDRTGIPEQQVTTLYHKHGGTARGIIAAIIQAHAEMKIYEDDPIVAVDAYGLHQDFPSISIADLEILLHITNNLLSARELAKALVNPANKKSAILLDIRHAPIELGPMPSIKPKPFNAVYPNGPHDYATSSQAASVYSETRNVEFAKAADAFRKAKSNPLMGGAAAYYSEVGRTYDAKAKAAASRAADALAASQSSKLAVDLHGLNVRDAVRISRERVTTWWHEHGEERADGRGAKVPPYKIVTGAGNHSSGGGKLGPAVAKMLLSEGWKIQVGSGNNMGFLLVLGISKRK